MTPAIAIRNLSYRYHDGTAALHALNLDIPEGDCVGLIGPNGAGKSTLLLHLNGILPDPLDSQTAIHIFGQALTRDHLVEIRRLVGVLFQDPDDQLFCPTVFEDVAFGPQQQGLHGDALTARVAEALAQVGLAGFERRSPHHLSHGEKSRVCLAGIMACSPRILALDEPTSNLDPRGRREFKALLNRIPATKIVATHDLELVVELCPRAILMDHGTIIADGPTRTLLNDEALMLAHGLEHPHILKHLHPH